jgi:hypothetical protein
MPDIDVPGVGTVSFPEGMNNADMASAIQRNFGPQLQAARAPEDVTAGMALRGVPVLGAYVPQAEAAIRAVAQPFTGVGEAGETYGERYARNLALQQAQYAQAERESPAASALLQAGGGIAATAPLAATAAGGRLLGATGGLLSRTAMGGASGAGLSYLDALARGEDPYAAAQTGGVIGAAAAPIASAVGRAITPFRSDAARAAAVRTLEQEGVTGLTAGQKTGSWLRYPESSLGEISGAGDNLAAQQYTQAVLRRAGINAEEALPPAINKGFEDIGKQYEQAAAKTAIWGTGNLEQLGNELQDSITRFARLTQGAPAKAPEHYLGRIIDAVDQNGGIIPGKVFQSISSDMARDVRSASNPDVIRTLGEMRNALNDAMERGAQGTPYETIWRQLNQRYRNLLTVQNAVGGAGEAAAQGVISPAQLRMAVGRQNYGRGRSSFDDLIRAGTQAMTPLPQSGTAPRSFWMQTVPGAIAGFGYGAYQGDPSKMFFGGLAGAAAAPIAGRALMHPVSQRYLANRLLAEAPSFVGAGVAPTIAREFQ